MVLNVSDVTALYKKTGGIMDDAAAGGSGPSSGGGASFADTLKGFAGDAIGSLKEGEKAAGSVATGKADLASVVTAIDNAEVVLTEVTTLRDKVITAYQAITSSAI